MQYVLSLLIHESGLEWARGAFHTEILNFRGHVRGHLRVHSRVHFREHFRERVCGSNFAVRVLCTFVDLKRTPEKGCLTFSWQGGRKPKPPQILCHRNSRHRDHQMIEAGLNIATSISLHNKCWLEWAKRPGFTIVTMFFTGRKYFWISFELV